jgi:hypothetical protein
MGGFVKDIMADYLINVCGITPPNSQKNIKKISADIPKDKKENKPTEKSVNSLLDF